MRSRAWRSVSLDRMGFISAPGPLELLVILALALLLLGPSRLPEAAKSVGRGFRELRDALEGGRDDEDEFGDEPDDEDVERDRDFAGGGPAAEAAHREAGGPSDAEGEPARRTPGTEAGDPAPPPVS